jgi:hypothetical protein
MRVVIVAKTGAPGGFCIGALSLKGESLRLLQEDGSFLPYDSPNHYSVGETWDVTFTRPKTVPPHVEDVHVSARTLAGNQPNLGQFIRGCTPAPWKGGVDALFDGKLGFTGTGKAYIGAADVPAHSTGFWLPDEDLTANGNRYEIGGTSISYVGAAPAVATIPAGTLVRASLARWWKPEDADDDFPERCYLQVSGWY